MNSANVCAKVGSQRIRPEGIDNMRYPVGIVVFLILSLCGCAQGNQETLSSDNENALRQVLYVQNLYNNSPEDEIVPAIQTVIDSMRSVGRTPYYYAAVNVLIDRLFSEGRFAEADSLAVRMRTEALEDGDSLSIAMSGRVRAQMFYKLSQPTRAMHELLPAGSYISDPYRSGSDFGTATSIREWIWIIARELGDTAAMNSSGIDYARMVERNREINRWTDTTGHYPVTALAFRAQKAFTSGDISTAEALLDSASLQIRPSLPARAYEHLYAVRCDVRAFGHDWTGALADADTLLSTHRDFPWFYLKDLLLKAELLNRSGRHQESADMYSEYVVFHDSLSNKLTDRRLHDLTVLYRTEIDREQKRAEGFRMFALAAVILILLLISIAALLHAAREKKRNRRLVERLKEYDRASKAIHPVEQVDKDDELSAIGALDRYMYDERPYTNPALSRKELAEAAGLSQDALGVLVKNEKGVSVRVYINSFRLEEARKVLGSKSNEGIAELASRLGFGTARTLQRAFKDRYGMSPSQYRDVSREIEDVETQ